MKTLIINGSPRKHGETMTMVEALTKELGGEIKNLDAYHCNVRPCVDCRWCFTNKGCAVKDDMQEFYAYIEECDHVILASPIYFEELTGMLLAVLSRLQTYFSTRFIRKEEPVPKKKTGGILLTAGSIGPREKAESTAQMLLRQLSCESLGTVYAGRTDKQSVKDREDVLEEVRALACALKNSENTKG